MKRRIVLKWLGVLNIALFSGVGLFDLFKPEKSSTAISTSVDFEKPTITVIVRGKNFELYYFYDRVLTFSELESLHNNPYQIFEYNEPREVS